jgi:hypothetical protein
MLVAVEAVAILLLAFPQVQVAQAVELMVVI